MKGTRFSFDDPRVLALFEQIGVDTQNVTRIIIDFRWNATVMIYTETMATLEPVGQLLEILTPSDALRGRE